MAFRPSLAFEAAEEAEMASATLANMAPRAIDFSGDLIPNGEILSRNIEGNLTEGVLGEHQGEKLERIQSPIPGRSTYIYGR
jgi:hypothetical protein